MSESARVHSVDALQRFKEGLAKFIVEAQQALCAADIDIRRVFDGLQAQLQHWQREALKRQEDVVRAKAELTRREWGHSRGTNPGTTDQEVALRKAQMRLQEAEAKAEGVRRWLLQLPHAIREYEGPARQLIGMLEADLKQSMALLERKITILEEYIAMAPGSEAGPATTEPTTESDAPADGTAAPPVKPAEA
jgi:hypothetical protein